MTIRKTFVLASLVLLVLSDGSLFSQAAQKQDPSAPANIRRVLKQRGVTVRRATPVAHATPVTSPAYHRFARPRRIARLVVAAQLSIVVRVAPSAGAGEAAGLVEATQAAGGGGAGGGARHEDKSEASLGLHWSCVFVVFVGVGWLCFVARRFVFVCVVE